jgi:general stress protein 26
MFFDKGSPSMASDGEIEAKFWKALKADMTVMLGLVNHEDGYAQPMTAQMDDAEGSRPIWFFSAKEVGLVRAIGTGAPAMMHFVSKGHELFASVEGRLVLDNDRSNVERLWNPLAAAWYEHGKDDPSLQLIRFDPEAAQIWLNENSLFAGIKTLFGVDPKRDYEDKVAQVSL